MSKLIHPLALLAVGAVGGCFGSVGRGARINHASDLPLLSEAKQEGAYPDAAGLKVQEVPADDWGEMDRSGKYLCRRGHAHDATVLKSASPDGGPLAASPRGRSGLRGAPAPRSSGHAPRTRTRLLVVVTTAAPPPRAEPGR